MDDKISFIIKICLAVALIFFCLYNVYNSFWVADTIRRMYYNKKEISKKIIESSLWLLVVAALYIALTFLI